MSTVLIVDDDPDFVETTRMILEANGHKVLFAANGDDALVQVRESLPDVVLLDVMMKSVLEGVYVSQEMWEDPALRPVPVIMISSIPNTPHSELFPVGEDLHVDGFLTKPVKADKLLAEITRLTSRRR